MLTYILIGLAGLLVLALLVMFLYASWIVHNITQVERVPVTGHPSHWGIPWQDASFFSRNDHVPLKGWFLPGSPGDRCIILIQGTEHHRNSPEIRALRLGRDLVDHGFSVFLFDFRARGESGGIRSSEGDREQWDVLGAIDYVTERGIPVEHIGLLGFSLGAGVALMVAAQEPRIPAIVSDSGFLDYMMDLQKYSIGPFLLPSWYTYIVAFIGRVFFSADFSKIRPAEVVDIIDQPIFFIHGEDDPVISHEETVELHELSDNPEDRIWIVPRAEHVNVYRTLPETYVDRVSKFFQLHIVL